MRLICRVTQQGLLPLYGSDYDEHKRLKEGDEVVVEIKRARNVKFHKKYFALLRLAHALFAVPNGGWRNEATGAKLKAEGVTAGVADLILLHPSGFGHYALLIEMKTEEGRQSMAQRRWQEAIEKSGDGKYRYKVVRSEKEFMMEVEWYLNLGKYGRVDTH